VVDVCYVLADLQAADKVKLKIYANSTRRALWHAKLGFHRSARPPVLSLHSLFANGGPVPGVDVVIMRIYPILVCITVVNKCLRCTVVWYVTAGDILGEATIVYCQRETRNLWAFCMCLLMSCIDFDEPWQMDGGQESVSL